MPVLRILTYITTFRCTEKSACDIEKALDFDTTLTLKVSNAF